MWAYKFALSLLATYALARPSEGVIRGCGTERSDNDVAAMEKHFLENKVNSSGRHDALPMRNLNIYWHVISTDYPVRGNISNEQIASQIRILNVDFAPMSITWTLVGTSHTMNQAWYMNRYNDNSNLEMRRTLRRGGAADLNIYSVGSVFYGNAYRTGYSSFPAEYQNSPVSDGIVLNFNTLPGGQAAPYNEGRTLTHEAGHWVGLYHPFQGGCTFPNDSVDDTPAERDFGSGCPTARDSCPGLPGFDLIHNHMDYTDDSCKESFTPGQITRASEQLRTYRGV